MAFDLEVEFTGLCLYVPQKNGAEKVTDVTVLMPDCRRSIANDVHADNDKGEPHVGYLRVNLANIDPAFKADAGNSLDGPKYEVVYQFDREELEFDVNGEAIDFQPLGLPSFGGIPAASGGLLDDITTTASPDELLFRTKLDTGTLRGRRGNGNWSVTKDTGKVQTGQFSEVITWRQKVAADVLKLKLTKFDGSATKTIELKPVAEEGKAEGVIRLKIANLCSTNPLEWDSLTLHVEREQDKDFKWLYRLFKLPAAKPELPVPELVGFQGFGIEDCLGGCFDD